MSSRLFQRLREDRGLCYTVFAQSGAYFDTGMVTIYAGTGASEIGELAELTIDEIKRAAQDMTEAEVARARAQMKAGLLMGLESPSRALNGWQSCCRSGGACPIFPKRLPALMP
jgi:predicted Zn-dependent peptidase